MSIRYEYSPESFSGTEVENSVGICDQVLEALEASGLAGRAQISGADAGLHFLVRLETERGDQELTQLARARGIRLSFLSEFCASPGPEHQHFLVISYPGIQMERLPQTLRELAALLH